MTNDAPAPATEGPGFDPGKPFTPELENVREDADEHREPVKLLTVPEMKKMLMQASKEANKYLGEHTKSNLTMTELEVALIAPGLVRYANARPTMLATFTGADYLKLAAGSLMYTGRNLQERSKAIAAELEAAAAADTFGASELVPLEPPPGGWSELGPTL